MKLTRKSSIILLAAGLAVLAMNGNSQTVDDQIQAARTTLQADRQATVAGAMQFTEQEAAAFWPLYEQYRAKMQPQGDAVLKLVKDYGQLYPNVPDNRAKVMLKDLAKFEKERVEIRSSYLKKIGKVLSPAKTLRFAQVDSRLDLATQIEIAASIPLVPVEGRLTGQGGGAAGVTEGVPGGQHRGHLRTDGHRGGHGQSRA
jgi:inorganic triphosphatase YgiF